MTLFLRTGEKITYSISFAPDLLPGEVLSSIVSVISQIAVGAVSDSGTWRTDSGGTIASSALTGGLSAATVTAGGSGYSASALPAVTVDAPSPGGTRGTLRPAVSSGGAVSTLTVVEAGDGYLAAPAVTIAAPGSGTQATATATVRLDTVTVHLDGTAARAGEWRRVIALVQTSLGNEYKSDPTTLFFTDV